MGEEIRMTVPANRTGIVIGKGGETIKQIKQQSGCDIELVKDSKGIFIIRGTPDRIQYAQQLINDKVNAGGNSGSNHSQSSYNDQQSYWHNYGQNDNQPAIEECKFNFDVYELPI